MRGWPNAGIAGIARPSTERRAFSERAAQLADEEVAARRRQLDRLAKTLLEKEVLDRSAIESVLAGAAPGGQDVRQHERAEQCSKEAPDGHQPMCVDP